VSSDGRRLAAHFAHALDQEVEWCRRNGLRLPDGWDALRMLAFGLLKGQDGSTFDGVAGPVEADPMTPEALSLQAVSAVLSCSLSTTKRLVAAGDLPAIRLGRSVRVRRTDLDAYLENK